ncbi:MAG: IS66 family transposase zinc-finger binding domain-containing protein, partial [Pseudomonadota bacterium]|nr:IS66 family transposase zinc-finger binding domain-containing protein [Pseudomonadota bacterium]
SPLSTSCPRRRRFACCQGALHRLGEEATEQIDIIPAKVQAPQHVRFHYAFRQYHRQRETSQLGTSPMPA